MWPKVQTWLIKTVLMTSHLKSRFKGVRKYKLVVLNRLWRHQKGNCKKQMNFWFGFSLFFIVNIFRSLSKFFASRLTNFGIKLQPLPPHRLLTPAGCPSLPDLNLSSAKIQNRLSFRLADTVMTSIAWRHNINSFFWVNLKKLMF